jgi:hypothetical protein
MTLHMQHIIQHLFQADRLEDVPRERLEALVEEYPSFGMARYLLSSKLRAEQADQFEETTRRTSLYFTNPFWLQWLLKQGPVNGAERKEWVATALPEIVVPEEAQEGQYFTEPIINEQEEMPAPQEQGAKEEPQDEQPVTESPSAHPIEEPAATHYAEQMLEEHPVELPVTEQSTEPVIAQQPAEPIMEQQFAEPVVQQVSPPVEEPSQVEARTIEPPLVFESYHMVDYFASQGIKLAPNENPTDRLGKQLKSFTEWLRVMKRLPQKEAGAAPDIVAEHKIQAIAAHSIEGKEVVTETMAEVLAKQGMWEQATAVYQKLSLLNPGKSGYFAAKIEQLKTN